MPHVTIPADRIAVLQSIVDNSPHAVRGGWSCDDLQAELDSYFGSAFDDPSEGIGYFFLFLVALIKGCDFVWEEGDPRYWADPFKQKPFLIEMCPPRWDARGSRLKMYDSDISVLMSNNINRKGDYDPSQDPRNAFHLAPAGRQLEGRDAYYIFVQDGPHAGKSLSGYWNAGAEGGEGRRYIHALEHDPATADMWTFSDYMSGHDSGGTEGRAIDNYTVDGTHQGRMDVTDGKGGQYVQVWPEWNGYYNQLFQPRPLGYQY
ncbi:hypothetical protein [Kitasatospora sp. NPDC059327]|uniref:hypothetical protein n=1 Tax=Kitasatospora sp. NPDC059327 TaxID=3346803 RepID=UPI0036A5EAB3